MIEADIRVMRYLVPCVVRVYGLVASPPEDATGWPGGVYVRSTGDGRTPWGHDFVAHLSDDELERAADAIVDAAEESWDE